MIGIFRGTFMRLRPSDVTRRILLVWATISIILIIININNIAHRFLPDPDDTLRLVQVRDFLAGQSWFDLHQYRADPLDGGVLMHWSRLVDMPIAATIMLFRPLLGERHAELVALVGVPLLTLLCALFFVGQLAWRRLGRDSIILTCLIAATSVSMIAQLRPMRIDHHGWQAVMALAGLNGLMARHRCKGGWASGVAMALGLAVSMEGLPLTLAFAGIGLWRWLRGDTSLWLTRYLAGLAIASFCIFWATHGSSDLAEHCDTVAPVHVSSFLFAALAVGLSSRFTRASLPVPYAMVLTGVLVTGLGVLALALAMAPQCLHGPFAGMDPVVHKIWLDNIAEGLPVWRQGRTVIVAVFTPPLAGLIIAAWCMRRTTGHERHWWQDYTAALAASLLVACMVERASTTACAFAALPLAWLANRFLHTARQGHGIRHIAAFAVIPLILVGPVLLATLLPAPMPAMAENTHWSSAQATGFSDMHGHKIVLANLGKANLLTPVDIAPKFLLNASQVTVLATGHHRGATAIREVIDSFTTNDDIAHAIVIRRHINFIIIHPDAREVVGYTHIAPQGLMAQLLAGHPPAWLRPVGVIDVGASFPEDKGFLVWQVIS